jgi:cell division septum initiation protein DivIVA
MEDLQRQINELKKRLDELTNSNSIPFVVEQALKDRLRPIQAEGQGTFNQTNLERTISLDAELTGNAQSLSFDFEVLEYPAGYLLIKYKENIYKVPYFND